LERRLLIKASMSTSLMSVLQSAGMLFGK